MDAKTTGRFIAELRKQKGYTQKELAEKIMVTDKAISRWETGKGLPDTSLLKPLGDILGVSVGELLSGKIIEEAEMKDQTDRIILDSLKYSSRMLANMVNLAIRLSVALILAPRFGIAFVWLAVPAGWLANFLISYVALRKSWPDDKMAFAAIEDGAAVFIEKYCK